MNAPAEKYNFATAPLWPLIVRMALPSIAAQLVNLLYNVIDRIYIGHLAGIGTDALAGVGVTSGILMIIASFAQVVGGGGAPLAAIAMGRGDEARAKEYLGNGAHLLLLFSIGLIVLCSIFMRPLLLLCGASDVTYGYAAEYLSVYLAGTFFVMVTIGLNPFINTQGKPRYAMASVLLGAVLNTILDPIFMFALHLGVRGAAIATVISQGASAFFILRFLTSKNALLRIERASFSLRKSTILSMLSLGITPFVMNMTEGLVGIILNSGLAAFGDIYVGALTIMTSAMQFISIPVNGFTQGANPVISFNYGKRDPARLKAGFRVVLVCVAGYNLLMTLALMMWPGVFADIFTDDLELIATVSRVMPVFLAGMTIFGLQRTCQNMFVSMDQPVHALFIALLRKIILLIPLALILPRFMGVMGIFTAEAVADAVAATCCTILFIVRFRKILVSMEVRDAGK